MGPALAGRRTAIGGRHVDGRTIDRMFQSLASNALGRPGAIAPGGARA
jgi:hypothetical protein